MELKLVWYRLKTEFFSCSFDQRIDRYETIDEIIRYDTTIKIKNKNGVVLIRGIPTQWPKKAAAEGADTTDKRVNPYSSLEYNLPIIHFMVWYFIRTRPVDGVQKPSGPMVQVVISGEFYSHHDLWNHPSMIFQLKLEFEYFLEIIAQKSTLTRFESRFGPLLR